MRCRLCEEEFETLENSHYIPSFVFKWIKDTSATGYLRTGKNVNFRVQDGPKARLLCRSCEQIFSDSERDFANAIFYPFVNECLGPDGTIQANRVFMYQDWLIRFALSLSWRTLLAEEISNENENEFSPEQKLLVSSAKSDWQRFLRHEKDYTSFGEAHLFFLQSFAGAQQIPADLAKRFPPRLHQYLLRAADATTVFSKKRLGVFSKIGPLVIYTTLTPHKLKNQGTSRIGMKGTISTIQSLADTDLSQFIYVTRPKGVLGRAGEMSESQREKISKTYETNIERAQTSMSLQASLADLFLREISQDCPKEENDSHED